MLNFARIQAGIYQAYWQGAKLNVNREGVSYWALSLDGEFVEAYTTLTAGQIAANVLIGIDCAANYKAATPKAPKVAKLPAIMHNPKGLYVFGLDELCNILAKQDLPGICRPHVTKRGKHGYFLDTLKAKEFWLLAAADMPGTQALCMGEGKKWEVTL